MQVTAITLSAKPLPEVQGRLVQVQTITSATEYCEAWLSAIQKVQTPYFYFLDDTDSIPDEAIIDECIAEDVAVAYTDETRDGIRIEVGEYDQTKHITNPMMMHHLVVCRTADAKAVAPTLPRGQFWPEMPMYFELAKRSVAYIPKLGYHWHKSDGGLSSKADFSIAQMRSAIWCARRKT